MTLQQTSAAVALVSAAIAVVVTVLGVFERRRAFAAQQSELQAQAKRWRAEIEEERRRQEALLRKDFLLEQYRYRLTSYGAVLRTLGAVSDVRVDPDADRYQALHQNKDFLRSTADALYAHLYGEPGLLMTMHTRNFLHDARRECLAFLRGDGDSRAGDGLVEAFYCARRYLRADLELLDDRTPENLDKLVDRLGEESVD
jgi:hypothetical protein